MIRLRHGDEWIGLVVLVALVLFVAAILQAGVLHHLFRPVSTLRILLPEAGGAGLLEGADIQLLGTHAGTVREIVLRPDQAMYAVAEIDDQARPFIRRDSHAVIRKSFGVAGAAFLDISRGSGAELDWRFAVINATTERDPTENIGALFDQVREKIFPVLDDSHKLVNGLAEIAGRLDRGEGSLGHLLKDDSLWRNLDAAVEQARDATTQLASASRDLAALTASTKSGENSLPALLKRTNDTLSALQPALKDLSKSTQQLPQIVNNVAGGTQNLGSLLTQTQQTAHELELLAAQLRGLWLLGGGAPTPSQARLPATELAP